MDWLLYVFPHPTTDRVGNLSSPLSYSHHFRFRPVRKEAVFNSDLVIAVSVFLSFGWSKEKKKKKPEMNIKFTVSTGMKFRFRDPELTTGKRRSHRVSKAWETLAHWVRVNFWSSETIFSTSQTQRWHSCDNNVPSTQLTFLFMCCALQLPDAISEGKVIASNVCACICLIFNLGAVKQKCSGYA